jgi:YihY family inner membrane protein
MAMRARQLLRIKNRMPKWRVGRDALSEFFENDLTVSAAAISYYAMLMLFPLLIVIFSVGDSIAGSGELRHLLVDRMLAYLPGMRQFVRENVETVKDVPTGAVVTCWILIAWASLWIFTIIEKAINRIWAVPPRAFLHGRLRSLLMIGVVGTLLLASTVLAALIALLQAASTHFPATLPPALEPLTGLAWPAAVAVTSFVVTTVMFAAIYKMMPNAEIGWLEVMPGAVITGLAWEGLKDLFAFLLPRFLEEYRLLYGSAWLALLLLTWVFMSSIVMLFGAQLTAVLHCRHEAADATTIPDTSLPPAELAASSDRARAT